MAAVDYFLKIEGVDKGESPDAQYKGSDGWIQIESWSFGASQGGTMQFGGGRGAGKVSMQDFHFTMKVNTASPKLFLACCSGEHFKKATVHARKAGKKQDPHESVLQLTGRTMCDRIVVFDGSPRLIGQMMPIMVYDTTPFTLFGSVVTSCVGPEVYTLT